MKSLIFLLLLTSSGAAQLHMVPSPTERNMEGAKFTDLVFEGKNRRVTYSPPSSWKWSASPNKIRFSIPNSSTEAFIESVPLEKEITFNEETIKVLAARTMTSISPTAKDLVLVQQETNPVQVSGRDTFELIVSYADLGKKWRTSILVVNAGNELLRMRLDALPEDFKKDHQTFIRSIASMAGL